MRCLRFSPVDTWQFGTGVPSQAGTATTLTRSSLMPPLPSVAVGAVRASLARTQGWDGRGRWPRSLDGVLGDGPGNLGKLHFVGPFLADGKGERARLLVPLPLAARELPKAQGGQGTGQEAWEVALGAVPGDAVSCDLGRATRLPSVLLGAREVPGAAKAFVTFSHAQVLVEGGAVCSREVVSMEELWANEPRTAIELSGGSRTALKGQLFQVEHRRPVEGKDVGLVVLVEGVPDDWPSPGGLVPFGAEGRLAAVTSLEQLNLSMAPSQKTWDLVAKSGKAVLVAVSPLWLSREAWAGQEPIQGLGGGRVVCAVTERPQRAGGWDSLRSEPVAQRSVLPPGTTVYVEHEDGEDLCEALARLSVVNEVVQVGEGREMGFGAVLVGPWPASTSPGSWA